LEPFQQDEVLTDAAVANSRRRSEAENARTRTRDLVFERNFIIRANELSPEFLMTSIQRNDLRGLLSDEDIIRLGVGYTASLPGQEDSDGRVSVQVSLIFATETQTPEIADPFYIPNLIDAGYSDAQIADKFEREIFRLTNIVRDDNNLSPLVWDDAIARVARSHSRDMGENSFFSNIGSDDLSPEERMQRGRGVFVDFISENISNRIMTPQATVDRWVSSPRQLANILSEDATHMGIGFVFLPDSQHEVYVTQMFGGLAMFNF